MGRQKLTTLLSGKPLLLYALSSFSSSRLDEVIVVASEEVAKLVEGAEEGKVRVVVNADPKEGMSASLRLALAEVRGGAALIGLGDQPLLLPSTIDSIVSAYEGSTFKVIVPVCMGRRGNPVLIDRSLFPQLLKIRGDVGAREVIAANPILVGEVDVNDEGVLFDVDTPSALIEARKALRRRAMRTRNPAAAPRRLPGPPAARSSSQESRRRRSTG